MKRHQVYKAVGYFMWFLCVIMVILMAISLFYDGVFDFLFYALLSLLCGYFARDFLKYSERLRLNEVKLDEKT